MFSLSNKQKDLISLIVDKKINFSPEMKINELNKHLYFYGSEICTFGVRVCWSSDSDFQNDNKWLELLSIIEVWEKPTFPIKAEDIINHGIEEGPLLGQILRKLESLWISSNFIMDKGFLLSKINELIK